MTRRLQISAVAAGLALLAAWKVSPFRKGDALGADATGLLFWLALGLLVGVLVSVRSLDPARSAFVPRDALLAAAAGFVVAAVLGTSLTLAIALLALSALFARLVEQGPWLLGLAAGALVGSLFGLVLDLVAAAVCVAAVVLLARKAAPAAAVVLLAALCLGWPTAHRASAADSHVDVGADKGFVNAHLKVTAGEVIHVKATGRVTFLKGVVADPNGYPARYSGCGGPGMCGVLIGRIDDAGAPFLLGSAGVVSAPAAGQLQLSVNDYDTADNSGKFSVKVWTTAAGTAPTVRLRPAGVIPVPTGSEGAFRAALLAALCVGLAATGGQLLGKRAPVGSDGLSQSSTEDLNADLAG